MNASLSAGVYLVKCESWFEDEFRRIYILADQIELLAHRQIEVQIL